MLMTTGPFDRFRLLRRSKVWLTWAQMLQHMIVLASATYVVYLGHTGAEVSPPPLACFAAAMMWRGCRLSVATSTKYVHTPTHHNLLFSLPPRSFEPSSCCVHAGSASASPSWYTSSLIYSSVHLPLLKLGDTLLSLPTVCCPCFFLVFSSVPQQHHPDSGGPGSLRHVPSLLCALLPTNVRRGQEGKHAGVTVQLKLPGFPDLFYFRAVILMAIERQKSHYSWLRGRRFARRVPDIFMRRTAVELVSCRPWGVCKWFTTSRGRNVPTLTCDC